MNHLINIVKSNRWITEYFSAFVIGGIVFFIVCGPRCLDVTNIGWLIEGDSAQHYLGWEFYRKANWTFPIGLSPNWGLENATSIIYADALPLFSIPFKLLDTWLPNAFQFYGIWFFLCFILQALFSWRLLRQATVAYNLSLIGCFLMTFSPIVTLRLGGHQSLAAHWLILWALFLVISNKLNKYEWALCISLSILVHPYFTVMVGILWCASLMGCIQRDGIKSITIVVINSLFVGTTSILTAWQVGLIGTSASPGMDTGWGHYSMNLQSFFNAMGTGQIFRSLPQGPGQYEGYAYLGAGIIFLIFTIFVLNQISFSNRPSVKRVLSWPLGIALILLLMLAITTTVSWGLHNFELVDLKNCRLVQTFRASGRFAWPVWYFIIFISIVALDRFREFRIVSNQSVILLAGLCCFIQVIDIGHWMTNAARDVLMKTPSEKWLEIDEGAWTRVSEQYHTIRLLRNPGLSYADWGLVSYIAQKYRLKTNVFYLARHNAEALQQQNVIDSKNIKSGTYVEDIAYVVQDKDLKGVILNKPQHSLLTKLDGLNILLPHWNRAPIGDVITENPYLFSPKVGVKYPLSSAPIANQLLTFGWSTPEPWGVWSEGNTVELAFLPPKESHRIISLRLHPFVAPNHPTQKIVIRDYKGTVLFSSTISEANEIEFSYKNSLVKHKSKTPYVSLTFELPNAISPANLGLSQDGRILGIGLTEIMFK